MNENSLPSRPQLTVPQEAAAILESTFQRILAESTFADAWPLAPSAEMSTFAEADLRILLPLSTPWKGMVLVGSTLANAKDLAAGYHSLPDSMVDRGMALDFLAELAELLARDLFCASDVPVQPLEPNEPAQELAASMWSNAIGARTALGCNGDGRMVAALVTRTA